jgi:D-alanyl-D-alanine endopeptidase (penicillin-binding protein 7)
MCVSKPVSGARILGAVLAVVLAAPAASAQSVVSVRENGTRSVDRAADDVRPIASVTKVRTALLVVEAGLDPAAVVTIGRSERGRRLRAGQRVPVSSLMTMMLLASDNGAARALARTAAGSVQAFVGRMNERAASLGLQATRYADPAGLLASNTSTAAEQARLLRLASHYDLIAGLMRTATAAVRVGKRTIPLRNTNHLLEDPALEVVAGKTGTTRKAGYCLATILKADDGEEVAVVVLGAKRPASRFELAVDAFNKTIGG